MGVILMYNPTASLAPGSKMLTTGYLGTQLLSVTILLGCSSISSMGFSININMNQMQGCQQTQIWNPENCAGGQGGRIGPLAGPGQRPGGGQGAKPPEAPGF